jgi:hypothetical protein
LVKSLGLQTGRGRATGARRAVQPILVVRTNTIRQERGFPLRESQIENYSNQDARHSAVRQSAKEIAIPTRSMGRFLAWQLQFRDVTTVFDDNLKKIILEIEVRGNRGTGLQKYAVLCCLLRISKPAPPGARLWRERADRSPRDICSSERRMAHSRTD